jgi:dipeptidyl aminopeptidase/acylaminoacyl peptidase
VAAEKLRDGAKKLRRIPRRAKIRANFSWEKHNMAFWRQNKFVLLFVIAGLLTVTAQLAAQDKKTITHETVWLMKRVGAPIPSPDGKWVLFSLSEPSYTEAEQVSDLWLVPADGSAKPRRLTNTKGGEGGAVWSPDGSRIAFSARREGDETAQIYVLDVINGGEAQRVTNLSTGANSPQWRPDGGAILFQSVVFPGAADDEANKKAAAERKAQKYRARVFDGFPIRQWDKWLDDTQTHVFVQELSAGAKAKDLLAGTEIVKKPGFSGAFGLSAENLQAIWAPDGASVIFVATTERNTAAYSEYPYHLFQIAATGGEPKQLTSGKYTYGSPRFSPDGKTLAAGVSENGPKVYFLSRLAVWSWPNAGAQNIITANSDRSVGGFRFAPDSRTIYFTAEDAGLEKLYSVPVSGGEVKLALDPKAGVLTNLAAAKNTVVANWDSAVSPAEIVRLDVATGAVKPLTEFNKERVAQIDWQPVRHFWFNSKSGKKIHNLLITPPAFDANKKYPLFVVIHGGPAGMWRDSFGLRWNYHLLGSPGYVVLLTNYTGSTGFGEKFGQDIQGDAFKTPGEEINQAADEAIKQFPFIDATRQAAGGASYGGHLANWMNATTTRYKCLISHAGLVNAEAQWGTSDTIYFREVTNGGPHWENGPLWREQNPIKYAAKFQTPTLITIGEQDFRVPLNNSLEAWSVLQRRKIPSRLIVFPEENHWILRGENSRFFYQEVHAWLKKWL